MAKQKFCKRPIHKIKQFIHLLRNKPRKMRACITCESYHTPLLAHRKDCSWESEQTQKNHVTFCFLEENTWPRGDMKFLCKCWKIFHEWAQQTGEIFFTTRREISYLQAAMLIFHLFIKTNQIPNHFTLIFFAAKGPKNAIYHVALLSNGERILHCRAEIRNFSSSAKKYLTSSLCSFVKYFFNTRREISYLQTAMNVLFIT